METEIGTMEEFPEEMVQTLCRSMDNKTLIQFVQSSSRNYDICNEILLQRKTSSLSSFNVSKEKVAELGRKGSLRPKVEYWINDQNAEIEVMIYPGLEGRREPMMRIHVTNDPKLFHPLLGILQPEDMNFSINDLSPSQYPLVYQYLKNNGFRRK